MTNRRNFIKQMSAAAIVSGIPNSLLPKTKPADDKIWACLLHISFNMWEEYISPHRPFRGFRPDIELSESLYNDALALMVSQGMNMVVLNIGDAISYDSHPEIGVNKAWTTTRLRDELKRIRKMGLEPIPNLNFSAAHDTWLKEYSRMVSTEKYYSVCRDLIEEVVDIFDKPRFFHLGYDEETASHQTHYQYIVVRQDDLWWKDFYFFIEEVEKNGSRPWIWSDYMWHHPDLFFKNMPKSVLQSNWYYGEKFDEKDTYVKAYLDLESHGYDQIPTGSYHAENEKSILNTVKFCEKNINNTRLKGFLQSFWKPTIEENRERILKGIELAGNAKEWYLKNHI